MIMSLFKSEDTGVGNIEDPDALLSKTDEVNLICYYRLYTLLVHKQQFVQIIY